MEWALRSRRVINRPASIHVREGRIAAVLPYDAPPPGVRLEDAGDLVILPGLVDTHVHINEPGRAHWEGFETATRAAAAGGVTTLVEMPLNSIPATTTVSAFEEKLAAAEGKCRVDTGFWGGVVPRNAPELAGMWEAGVFGFKCFLTPSGVDEFRPVGETHLREAMAELARLDAPLLAHAEILPVGVPLNSWLASRPPEAEHVAIAVLLRLARETGARVHIVHLAASGALAMIGEARAEGVNVTVETCPHYLFFAAEEIPEEPLFKCAPPIRERTHRDALRAAVRDGRIDLVVSDHSPSPPEMKRGGLVRRASLPAPGPAAPPGVRPTMFEAWGGIASLELGLAAVATWLDDPRVIAERMCAAPAQLAGLARKGRIAPGCDADLVVWDPGARWTCDPERLQQRHKLTPYAGRELHGRVRTTYLRGERIYHEGEFPTEPQGRILKR